MQRKKDDVKTGLTNKGFRQKEGDHHYYIYYTKAGKKTSVFTKTSHSGSDIDDGLLGLMAKQCKLTKASFLQLVDCPMSRDQYEAELIVRGAIREAEPSPVA